MRAFLRRISPRQAVADFADQWRQPTEHRWPILGVAVAATFCLLMLFIPRSERIEPEAPDIIYISTFDESRTPAQIIASNCANQRLKDELQARLDERAELRRDLYRALGRATFIDVDAMEREIEAERAAEAAAQGPARAPDPETAELALNVEEYCARVAG